jgi:dTMP kinase
MTPVKFYTQDLIGVEQEELPGRLIVLEGTDGVGRSTQIALLREWLESNGYAVASTGLKRSKLAGKGIKAAQTGHTLGVITSNLFYATDFADRMEKVIIPALRAGFVVLTDRYFYSLIARAVVRGVDPQWIRDVFGYALVPDAVFYMEVDLANLIPRLLNDRGFDYWESGMDFLPYNDYYESYMDYQSRLLAQFDRMSDEFHFRRVDATKRIPDVFKALKADIKEVLKDMKPSEVIKPPKEKEKDKTKGR